MLIYSLWLENHWRKLPALMAIGLIGFAFANTFWFYQWTPPRLKTLLPVAVIPLQDHALDYEQYRHLLADLDTRLNQNQRLYLAASHGVMNEDVLFSAEQKLLDTRRLPQHILPTAQVDSRDWLPFNELLQADYIAFTVSFIPHLPPQEQDIIRMVMQAFVEPWPFSSDFKLIRQFSFQAMNGFQLRLYQRLQPTDIPTALDTLGRMRAEMDTVGGEQKPWLPLGADSAWQIKGALQLATYRLRYTSSQARPSRLAYYPLLNGTINWQATVHSEACPGSRLELIAWRPDIITPHHSVMLSDQTRYRWETTLLLSDSVTLVLALFPASQNCQLELTDIILTVQN